MRATRVIYVENDPALRGILARLLERREELELVLATGSCDEALASPLLPDADVALLDLALGPEQMNGIDLGLSMRRINPNIGVVIHSQHSLDQIDRRLTATERIGWSTLEKSGDMRVADLTALLVSTAKGMSQRATGDSTSHVNPVDQLTPRQRSVMALAATGLSTKEIARRLDSTELAVRQDLSKAYKVLVPDATEVDDLRTKAVLTYLRLTQPQEWSQT